MSRGLIVVVLIVVLIALGWANQLFGEGFALCDWREGRTEPRPKSCLSQIF